MLVDRRPAGRRRAPAGSRRGRRDAGVVPPAAAGRARARRTGAAARRCAARSHSRRAAPRRALRLRPRGSAPCSRASSTLRSQRRRERAKSSAARASASSPGPRRSRAGELGSELIRHPPRALPVAPREAHDVAVEALERALRRARPATGRAPRRGARSWVRRASVPSCCARAARALGGHHHELVPAQQHLDAVEVGELGEALAQLLQVGHRREAYAQPVSPGPAPGPIGQNCRG